MYPAIWENIGGVQLGPSPFQGPLVSTKLAPSDVQVYPNPVQDDLLANLPDGFGTGSWVLEIIAANDLLMRKKKYLDFASRSLSVENMPQGIYALRLLGGGEEVVKKSVKK